MTTSNRSRFTSVSGRVFVARLAGTSVFDPIGDLLGQVHDVVVIIHQEGAPRIIGLVVEVVGRRRVFFPITRITSIQPGAVITTGLVNIRRFQQRSVETLVMGELLDRELTMKDGSGNVQITDIAMEKNKQGDWLITTLFVQRVVKNAGLGWRKGETLLVDVDQVTSLQVTGPSQGAAALLATMEDLHPADLADMISDLPDARRVQVAVQLSDERLADVLEELGDEDRVEILSAMSAARAADVLDEMQPDDAADLVSELPTEQATQLLSLMEPDEARDVRRLLAYDEHEAGGLMTTEAVILPPEATVATMLAHVRREDIPPALAAMAFIVRPPLETPTGRYLGVVHIQRALREPPGTQVGNILDTDVEYVLPEDQIGTVTRLLATYNYTAVPVLDTERRLLGAVSVDDVLDHLLPDDWREADEEITDEAITRSANG